MFNPKTIDLIDEIDKLTTKTNQLEAMLTLIHGCGFDNFNDLNDHLKQNYIWACTDHAKRINDIASGIALNRAMMETTS